MSKVEVPIPAVPVSVIRRVVDACQREGEKLLADDLLKHIDELAIPMVKAKEKGET